ncbi:YlxM family DNA-binding protein [Anaerocolumna sp.]|uniref:YlxM family DNA-binding protein n=1 Tax=Anaerocolumna sp. TaxID=2041569 RepID=UPI0028AA9D1C|nr:sigma factor-like helix-turn-helix DNA-binding protein [Anaerocolumna sp.]
MSVTNSSIHTEIVNTDDKIKEKVELSILFDFYGELLKNHNKQIFEDYILNDLSLSEIADGQGISRQGVHDIVKRCSKQLRECEEKLNFIKEFNETKVKVNRIKEIAQQRIEFSSHKEEKELHQLNEIIGLTKEILEEL